MSSVVLLEFNDSKFVEENDFLTNFITTEDISSDYLTPGRKRMLENKTDYTDWEFNQDMSYEDDLMIDDEVLHKKYGKKDSS